MKLKKILSLFLGLVVLAAVGILIGSDTVGASPRLNPLYAATPTPPIPVTVANTPLPVSGMVSANILGTPNVNATLSNASVSINNTPTTPVLVRDVDNPAGHPYTAKGCNSVTGVDGCLQGPGYDVLTVPSTTPSGETVKMLVVEFVSGVCHADPGLGILATSLSVTPPVGLVVYPNVFVPHVTFSDSSIVWYAFSQQTRIYVTPGSVMQIATGFQGPSNGGQPSYFCNMTINGHFVAQ